VPAPVITLGAVLGAGVLLTLLERMFPYREEWRRAHGDVRTDAQHFMVSNGTGLGWRWLNAATTASSLAAAAAVPARLTGPSPGQSPRSSPSPSC
jgi:hypothetical protein